MRRLRRALIVLCWLSWSGHRWEVLSENYRGNTHLTTTWRCARCKKRQGMLAGMRPE